MLPLRPLGSNTSPASAPLPALTVQLAPPLVRTSNSRSSPSLHAVNSWLLSLCASASADTCTSPPGPAPPPPAPVTTGTCGSGARPSCR
jgi:hypothetical protein